MMELGNMIFGCSRGEYPVNRDYQQSFIDAILEPLGFDVYGHGSDNGDIPEGWNELTPWGCTNGVFTIRPYWWGDCTCGVTEEAEEHKDTCALVMPNFECHPLGFTLKCYKYFLRDSYSNQPLTQDLWAKLVAFVPLHNPSIIDHE